MHDLTPISSTQEAAQRIFNWFSKPGAVFGYNAKTRSCFYRGNDNGEQDDTGRHVGDACSFARCAIGCLIPDAFYKVAMESGNFCEGRWSDSKTIGNHPYLKIFFENVDVRFLYDAQSIHDTYAKDGSMTNFLNQFVILCNKYVIQIDFSSAFAKNFVEVVDIGMVLCDDDFCPCS